MGGEKTPPSPTLSTPFALTPALPHAQKKSFFVRQNPPKVSLSGAIIVKNDFEGGDFAGPFFLPLGEGPRQGAASGKSLPEKCSRCSCKYRLTMQKQARLAELRDALLSRPMSGELSFDVTFSKMRGRYYADIL